MYIGKRKHIFRGMSATQEVPLRRGVKQWGRGDFRGVARRVIWKLFRSGEPWGTSRKQSGGFHEQ